MKNLMKRLSHPSRGMLFIFCLVISLSLVIIALSQLRTRAQVQSGKIDQKQSSAGQDDDRANTISDDSPDAQVIEIPAGYPGLPSGTLRSKEILASQGFGGEVEPNNTFDTATPLGGSNVVVRANIFPNADIDFYSFTAAAGDRVYAATMTSFSPSSTDSELTLLASDGTTVIEFDDDNGTFASLSSSIAGATISAPGTYYLKVNTFSATSQIRPYELHFRLQSGVPTPEVEGNDSPATANALPPNGWVSGARNPAAATEQDWFSITLAAGDTVYLALDLDPERDVTTWNGRLGFGLFGDASNFILVVDDAGTADTIDSEAMFFTVKTPGTYFAFVDSATAATGGPTATYHLSVSVHPATNEGVNCTTYTSTDSSQAIGPGATTTSSTITVPGSPRIQDLDVSITLNHTLMNQIDAHLRSPAANDNGLFTDIGASAVGGQNQMNLTLDDEAAIPPLFTIMSPVFYKPELAYRLSWFDGENAGGTWTLDLRDDVADANGGTLTSWSMTICEQPPDITCPFGETTVFSTDFEADDGGFTHSGVSDEWERGLPATAATTTTNPVAAFTTCNSGVNCWKTDLDNTYNSSSNQDLFSPNIDLTMQTGPVVLSWAQRYQIESATFDHAFVEVQEVGGAGATRQVWQWLDGTMTNAVGSPAVNIGASAGWGNYIRDISDFAGKIIRVRFHLDSDTIVNLAGLAIDDVTVRACSAEPSPTPTPTPTPTPNIVAGPATITAESCSPADNALSPGETVTIQFGLKNNGGASTTNLVATLQPTGGVTNPSGPQNYGAIPPDNTTVVSRPFTFTVGPGVECGDTVTATFDLQDGANNLGTVSFTLQVGAVGGAVVNNYSSGDIAVPIPDVSTVEVPINVPDNGVVQDVNVRVRLNHTFDGDLEISLVHPDGTVITLSNNRGGSGDNFGTGANNCSGTPTVFDDEAGATIASGVAPFAGSFRPESPLSGLDGKTTQGTWKLRVADQAALDVGIIGCVSLEITQFVCCGVAGTPVIEAGPAILTNESCPPANTAIDPGERVTVNLELHNNGTAPTTDLVATLTTGGGVSSPSLPQSYGALAPAGGSATRDFSFTASGVCGGTLTATWNLNDGPNNLGTVTKTFTLGCTSPCGIVRLVTTSTISRLNATTVKVTYQVKNIGTILADDVTLTSSKLGSTNGGPVPQFIGDLPPDIQSPPFDQFFTNSTPGISTTLKLDGTYVNGTFSSTKRVTIP